MCHLVPSLGTAQLCGVTDCVSILIDIEDVRETLQGRDRAAQFLKIEARNAVTFLGYGARHMPITPVATTAGKKRGAKSRSQAIILTRYEYWRMDCGDDAHAEMQIGARAPAQNWQEGTARSGRKRCVGFHENDDFVESESNLCAVPDKPSTRAN